MKNIFSTGNEIYISSIDELGNKIDQMDVSSVIVIADENTSVLCVPRLKQFFQQDRLVVLPAGEQSKTLQSCEKIWDALIKMNADRDCLILNVGGGVICDIGGFAASCFQRGIRFGNVPTTVLSMSDAAIGGKTGVDYAGLKNYIGVIRFPEFIWIDEGFLETLEEKEKISGFAEIVKHAIIGSTELWNSLEEIDSIHHLSWKGILEKNLPIKVRIVEADPCEHGLRKVLNFGHTIGHALESHYLHRSKPAMHGDCVATGMLIEAKMSNSLGILNNNDFEAIERLIGRLLKPIKNSLPTFAEIKPWMIKDKKSIHASPGFSLPDKIGSCKWNVQVAESVIAECFTWYTQAVQR